PRHGREDAVHEWFGAVRNQPNERRVLPAPGVVGEDLLLTSAIERARGRTDMPGLTRPASNNFSAGGRRRTLRPCRFADPIAVRTPSGTRAGSRDPGRVATPHVARVARGVFALTIALGATPAHAFFLPLSHFGSPGSGAGQFQTPVGVAVDQMSGAVYV